MQIFSTLGIAGHCNPFFRTFFHFFLFCLIIIIFTIRNMKARSFFFCGLTITIALPFSHM